MMNIIKQLKSCMKFMLEHPFVFVKGMEPEWSGIGAYNDIERYLFVKFAPNAIVIRHGKNYDKHIINNPIEEYGKTWAFTREELE